MALALYVADATAERFTPHPAAAALYAEHSMASHTGRLQLPEGLALLDFRARLDNRTELGALLGLTVEESIAIPTDRLILRAYQRWGESLVSHLRGDWWFALWDGAQRHLVLARDPTGPTPLFYCQTGAQFAFSPSLVDLLGMPGVPTRLCEQRFVSLLLPWFYGDYSQTEYEGVFQLLPGHSLTLDTKGMRLHRYWRPEDLTPVRLTSDDDYVEAFLALYRQAVADRVAGSRRVGSMLSAGLDSSSVTALAAQALNQRGEHLLAFTHVPLPEVRPMTLPTQLVDEWPLAQATARMAGTVEHVAIQSEHLSPMRANQLGLEMTGVLQCTNPNAPWMHVLYDEARKRGLDTLLSGQFGNIAASWEGSPTSIWSLLAQGQWTSARRTLLAGRAPTLHTLVRAVGGQLWRSLKPQPRWAPTRLSQATHSVLAPDMAKKWRCDLESQVPARPPCEPQAIRQFILETVIAATAFNGALAAAYGLESPDPTADQRLIEFCLAVPNEQFSRDGQGRRLMRRAMQGILPTEVQHNPRRGLQPVDYVYRLLANKAEVDALMTLMQRSDLARQYLDVPRLRHCWSRLQPTISLSHDVYMLSRGLGAAMLLIRIEGIL